jgi:hypothetical protein
MTMRWRWLSGAGLVLGILLTAMACRPKPPAAPAAGKEEPAGPDWFEDITAASGIHFTYFNGEKDANHLSILESLGGGVGLIDYDGDGLLDVFLPGGGGFAGKDKKDIVGKPCKLYKNLGKGKFKDVTAEVGLDRLAGGQPWFYTHGVAVGDFDRDGRPDLLVTGWGRVALFRNVDGKRFEDVSAKAGLDKGITWATSAAWADLDGDGYPDLYVCQYVDWSFHNHPQCTYDGKTPDVCPPKQFSGLKHKVYRNNRDGTFTDQTESAGLLPGGKDASKGLGVIIVDVNGDRKPDVYVANDTVNKFLYINESKPGQIRFSEQGVLSGAACGEQGGANGSMGLGVGDFDRSGKPSLWVTNYQDELHGLYKNGCKNGPRPEDKLIYFHFQTQKAGIAAIGQKYVGWGTAFVDFDLDGWEDIYVANGHAIRYPTKTTRKQKPVLLRNRGGKFKAISRQVGSYGQEEHLARGVGFGDLDNDGRVDMIISHINDPVAVLRNVAGTGRHWLGVRLVGKDHACTVGSQIVLEVEGEKQSRFVTGGGSYLSASDPRQVFGLGESTRTGKLTVTWPDGTQQEFKGLAADRYHRIVQGKEQAIAE